MADLVLDVQEEIIYKNLSFYLQIKLRKSSINIKNELEKLKSMQTDEVDLKKQIIACKNMPNNIKKLRNITRPLRMFCNFSKKYDETKLIKTIENLAAQINSVTILPPYFNPTAKKILTDYPILIKYDNTVYKKDIIANHYINNIMNNIFNNYFGFRQNIVTSCKPIIKSNYIIYSVWLKDYEGNKELYNTFNCRPHSY
jgi:hypothetical protein